MTLTENIAHGFAMSFILSQLGGKKKEDCVLTIATGCTTLCASFFKRAGSSVGRACDF